MGWTLSKKARASWKAYRKANRGKIAAYNAARKPSREATRRIRRRDYWRRRRQAQALIVLTLIAERLSASAIGNASTEVLTP
jgi:hypothetical protein